MFESADFIIEELKDLKKSVQRQQMMYNERMHMIEPAMYGKYPSEKTQMEMRRAIKQVMANDFAELPLSKLNSIELREIVLGKVMENTKVKRFFAGPEEFEHVFQNAYQELVA